MPTTVELSSHRMPNGFTADASASPDVENPTRHLARLLRYLLAYLWQFFPAILLMAMVGLLDAFRVLLIGPIFDRVLNPGSAGSSIRLFTVPGSDRTLY